MNFKSISRKNTLCIDAQADERGAEELRRHLLRLQQEHTELKKVPREW